MLILIKILQLFSLLYADFYKDSATFWPNLMANVAVADNLKMKHITDIEVELIQVLQKQFPTKKLWAYSFGSRIMGVAQEDSDLDIYVKIGQLAKSIFREKLSN